MALYENNIKLKGFLGKDAENFATKQQKTFTVLSLATKSGYKDKQKNEWVNHTEWHRIVAFGKPADYAKNLKKGDYVEIEGELRSSEFDVQVGEGKKKTIFRRHHRRRLRSAVPGNNVRHLGHRHQRVDATYHHSSDCLPRPVVLRFHPRHETRRLCRGRRRTLRPRLRPPSRRCRRTLFREAVCL